MPKQPASSKPFLIARPTPSDRVIFARAYASLGCSDKLLQQGSPSSFLGDQRYGPFQLTDENGANAEGWPRNPN